MSTSKTVMYTKLNRFTAETDTQDREKMLIYKWDIVIENTILFFLFYSSHLTRDMRYRTNVMEAACSDIYVYFNLNLS